MNKNNQPLSHKNAEALIKQLDEALRESEKKYRSLTENITVGIFRSTPGKKGNFIEVNPAFVNMLGYNNKHELYAQDVSQIYQDPKDREKFSEKLSTEGAVRNEELKLNKKDGTPIIVSATAVAVKHEAGKILFFDGIVDDITEQKKVQEELYLQKTYLEELFNSAPEAIVLHDNDDRIVNINAEFTRMFGYTREEALGKPINSLVAPKEFENDAAQLSHLVIHGKRVEKDSKRKRKDGTLIDVSILGAPIFHGGKQMGVYAIYRDISQRKKSEEELLLQKTYLEKLYNSAPEAIVLHDNNDLIANVNDEFTKVFGYTREEAIGKPINDLLATKELMREAELVSKKVMSGKRIEMETKRKRKDGSLVDVSILGAPIVHNGKQLADYAIYRDISERKEAEDELLIQKTYLEELFNSAPEAIVLHDDNDRIVNVNDEFTRMFGYLREEALGKQINDLVAPDEYREEAETYSTKVIHGQRVEAEAQRKRKDGTLIDVSILGAPILHDGEQMGVYAIYRDITEQKKAREARIRLKEEARMARNIQMNFLPKTDPVIPGYDIAGKSIPAMNVGGDYYDFIWLDDYRLAIGLGDVSGNGLAASLVMANLQATIRGQALINVQPDACLERANKLLFRSTDARTFVSLFYGILDTRKHSLIYANAGQDLPVHFSKSDKPKTLDIRGIALGMKEDVSHESEEIKLQPGDKLLIYSDGIREAMNDKNQEFGDESIKSIVKKSMEISPTDAIRNVFSAVHTHIGNASQKDDMTMVLLERHNPKK